MGISRTKTRKNLLPRHRIRKQINGIMHDKTFANREDARAFEAQLVRQASLGLHLKPKQLLRTGQDVFIHWRIHQLPNLAASSRLTDLRHAESFAIEFGACPIEAWNPRRSELGCKVQQSERTGPRRPQKDEKEL